MWYKSSWLYRIKITVDHTKIDSDLTDFPVYVNLGNLPSATFWAHVKDGGGDIRVTKADGTSEVPREVVSCNTTTEEGELHFKAAGTDALSSSTDTDFYIYYGNASASDYDTDATNGAENVWDDDFVLVSHAGCGCDSVNNFNLNPLNGIVAGGAAGKIDKATTFGPAAQQKYFESDNTTLWNTILDYNKPYSFSAFIKPTVADPGVPMFLMAKIRENVGYTGPYMLLSAGELQFGFHQNHDPLSTVAKSTGNGVSFSDNTWAHVVGTYDGSNDSDGMHLYVNGEEDITAVDRSNGAVPTTGFQHNDPFLIGARGWGKPSGQREFVGEIDEVRVSSVKRDSDWISAEYENQNAPASFYTDSAEETAPIPTVISEKITITIPATTGQQTYTLNNFTGVTPKAVIATAVVSSKAANLLPTAILSVGYATGPNNQWCNVIRSNDNQTVQSDTYRGHNQNCIYEFYNADGSQLNERCEFVSFSVNSITVNWSAVFGNGIFQLNLLVLGGSELEAHVGVYNEPDPAGIQSCGGASFTPNVSIFSTIAHNDVVPSYDPNWAILYMGMTDGLTQYMVGVNDIGNLDTSDASRVLYDDKVLKFGGLTGAYKQATFDSFYNGGININWDNATTGNRPFGVLHLKAPNAKVFQNTFPTATGTKDITGFGFDPNTVLATSCIITMPDVIGNDSARLGIGFADQDGVAKTSGFFSKSGVSTTETSRFCYDALLVNTFENVGIINRIDFDQYIADGFRINATAANTKAHLFGGLALGEAAGVTTSTDYDLALTIATAVTTGTDYDLAVAVATQVQSSTDYDLAVAVATQVQSSTDYDLSVAVATQVQSSTDYDLAVTITTSGQTVTDYDLALTIATQEVITTDYDLALTLASQVQSTTDYDLALTLASQVQSSTDYDLFLRIFSTAGSLEPREIITYNMSLTREVTYKMSLTREATYNMIIQ